MNRFLNIINDLRPFNIDKNIKSRAQGQALSHSSSTIRSSYEYESPSYANQNSKYSLQQNPLVVGGIAISDAISIGLAGVGILQAGVQSVQGSFVLTYDKAERLLTNDARIQMPQAANRNNYLRRLFSIPQARLGTANANINARWQGNAYGEISTVIFERDLDSSSDWSRSSFSINITRVNQIPNTQLDPRAWPIIYNYVGSYDPVGNGHWEFDGEFELNALGGLKFNRHRVVSRSLADLGTKPEDWVRKSYDTPYAIPPLPSDQFEFLRRRLNQ